MMPAPQSGNNNALIAKPANKKQRSGAKKPRNSPTGEAYAYSGPREAAYGLWTFPASAEAAAAFFAPPTHPLLAAVPRPAPQPLAAE